jgi:hypothetical protein
MFTDFGLFGEALDIIRGRVSANDEKKLRERFVTLAQGFKPGANCYSPRLGSPEHWEAETMAEKGWFERIPPHGYMLRDAVHLSALQ